GAELLAFSVAHTRRRRRPRGAVHADGLPDVRSVSVATGEDDRMGSPLARDARARAGHSQDGRVDLGHRATPSLIQLNHPATSNKTYALDSRWICRACQLPRLESAALATVWPDCSMLRVDELPATTPAGLNCT